MRFHWEQQGSTWTLVPSIINVREDRPGAWNIYIGDRPFVRLSYTAASAAKRDAWIIAKRYRREYFGVYLNRSMVLEG